MEYRLQPGSGSPAPRLALFALLATLAILLVGIYWFYIPNTIHSQEQVAIEPPCLMRSSERLTSRREGEDIPSVVDLQVLPVSPELPVPSPGISRLHRPIPARPPMSKSILEAMAQNDPEDPEEQGDDIAVLKDEMAAHPQAVGPAIVLSRRLMQAGRYTEAAQELRQVLRQDPTHLGARFQFGSALAAQGHKEEAIQEWRSLVATGDPTWSSIAQGSISRITHPEQPDIAIPETTIPDMRPAPVMVPLQE